MRQSSPSSWTKRGWTGWNQGRKWASVAKNWYYFRFSIFKMSLLVSGVEPAAISSGLKNNVSIIRLTWLLCVQYEGRNVTITISQLCWHQGCCSPHAKLWCTNLVKWKTTKDHKKRIYRQQCLSLFFIKVWVISRILLSIMRFSKQVTAYCNWFIPVKRPICEIHWFSSIYRLPSFCLIGSKSHDSPKKCNLHHYLWSFVSHLPDIWIGRHPPGKSPWGMWWRRQPRPSSSWRRRGTLVRFLGRS